MISFVNARINKPIELESSITPLRQIYDEKFGEITIFEMVKYGKKYSIFCREKVVDSLNDLLSTYRTIEKQLQNIHTNSQKILDFSISKKDALCGGSYYLVKSYYEYFNKNLKNEVKTRIYHSKKFSDEEVWAILYSI